MKTESALGGTPIRLRSHRKVPWVCCKLKPWKTNRVSCLFATGLLERDGTVFQHNRRGSIAMISRRAWLLTAGQRRLRFGGAMRTTLGAVRAARRVKVGLGRIRRQHVRSLLLPSAMRSEYRQEVSDVCSSRRVTRLISTRRIQRLAAQATSTSEPGCPL